MGLNGIFNLFTRTWPHLHRFCLLRLNSSCIITLALNDQNPQTSKTIQVFLPQKVSRFSLVPKQIKNLRNIESN